MNVQALRLWTAGCALPARRKPWARVVAPILLAAGLVVGSQGAWILVKAQLAQVLLHHAWNRTVAGREAVKPWPWADTWPVARIRIRRGADYIVLAGASGRTLAFGPGHLDGSAQPGTSGNCVISAHRDTQFAAVRKLTRGDRIQLTDRHGRVHHYEVRETRIVDKGDTSVLETGPGGQLTLITCYPFDAVSPGGRLRYVVTSDLLGPDALP